MRRVKTQTNTREKMQKPSNSLVKCKVNERAREMVRSLLEDGYRKRFQVMLPQSCFYSLKHYKNGSIITIVGNYDAGVIRLTRDGRLRHSEQL